MNAQHYKIENMNKYQNLVIACEQPNFIGVNHKVFTWFQNTTRAKSTASKHSSAIRNSYFLECLDTKSFPYVKLLVSK